MSSASPEVDSRSPGSAPELRGKVAAENAKATTKQLKRLRVLMPAPLRFVLVRIQRSLDVICYRPLAGGRGDAGLLGYSVAQRGRQRAQDDVVRIADGVFERRARLAAPSRLQQDGSKRKFGARVSRRELERRAQLALGVIEAPEFDLGQ